MNNTNFDCPHWAKEQLSLRHTIEAWIAEEIDRYERKGFDVLSGDKGGHALDEAGGYTRAFVSAYCLNGDERIVSFMKSFRDEWHEAVKKSGHFYHGYDANEEGDYITHTAEPFTQFLLNVLYLDITDGKTIGIVEDAAEHLGNWSPDVQDWYDWDEHVFLSYFPGTRSPYHKPPYNFQSSRHFRALAIASAAYEATGKTRYLELCCDYWKTWQEIILAAPEGADIPMMFFLTSDADIRRYAGREEIMNDWRFRNYYRHLLAVMGLGEQPPASTTYPGLHMPHDLIMTMLDVMRFVPDDEGLREGLHRVMKYWIDLEGRVHSGEQPCTTTRNKWGDTWCGVHLPKYRDITGDKSLDDAYLQRWPIGPCSYLLTGDTNRLTGVAQAAEAAFRQAQSRNRGDFGQSFATDHSCSAASNASKSTYVMPNLFSPALGGLGVHFGRAPWVNVLYYTDGKPGLPDDVAALYVPPHNDELPKVRLVNCGTVAYTISPQCINPAEETRLVLTAHKPDEIKEIVIEAGQSIAADVQYSQHPKTGEK